MGKIFVDVGISLDGFLAGLNPGPSNPLGDGGMDIHTWMFNQQAFLKHLQLGDGGETGKDNDLLTETFERTGACIMGKTMFMTGEHNWPEEAPFHCPVFVLTHEKREPWERKGGTTFYFINDGPESALDKAQQACGNRDIRISGGADVIGQFLNAGAVDEMIIHIAPILLGKGIPLFGQADKWKFGLEIAEVTHSLQVTHLKYRIMNN